jgi:hypothetical protein
MHSWVLRKEFSKNRQLIVHNRSIDAFGLPDGAFGALRRAFSGKRPYNEQVVPNPIEASGSRSGAATAGRVESGHRERPIK